MSMTLTLHVWRQKNAEDKGQFEVYQAKNVNKHMSFLEMLDVLNEELTKEGKTPIAFSHDCREGICGSCGMMIDGKPHGPWDNTTVCQLHMREFNDGDVIVIEPWRATAFPVQRDLIVDRGAFDRIIQAGGYISVATGNAPDGNAIPIGKDQASDAFDAATCIGCGACVAACPNASASLFTSAKLGHLNTLPQGAPEQDMRTVAMVETMDGEGFGSCTNIGFCAEACPKGISTDWIAKMNRDYMKASLRSKK